MRLLEVAHPIRWRIIRAVILAGLFFCSSVVAGSDPFLLELQAEKTVQHIRSSELEEAKRAALTGLEMSAGENDDWEATYYFYLGLISQIGSSEAEDDREASKLRNEAFDSYQKCLRLDSGHVASMNNLGKLYMDLDYHELAIDILTRSYKITGTLSAVTALNLADQYFSLDSPGRALDYLLMATDDFWEDSSFVSQAVGLLSGHDSTRTADFLWTLIENQSYRAAAKFAMEDARQGQYSDLRITEALVVWALATARSHFHGDLLNTSELSELSTSLEPGSYGQRATKELILLYGKSPLSLADCEWWVSNTHKFGPATWSISPREGFGLLLESLGQWLSQNGQWVDARRVYELAIEYPGNETKPDIFSALADVYLSLGLHDELRDMVENSTPRLMVAKGEHYRNWDPELAYQYHIALGNILSAVEGTESSEGMGVVSAEFQLERALELVKEADRSRDVNASAQQTIRVYPRTVTALAGVYSRQGRHGKAFDLVLDWTEYFIEKQDINSANLVFGSITEMAEDGEHILSYQDLSRYKELLYTRPWEKRKTSSGGFRIVINNIKIVDNRKSRSPWSLFGLLGGPKADVVLYSVLSTNQTRLVGLRELARTKEPQRLIEIVEQNIRRVLGASVCRGLPQVKENRERSFTSSQAVIYSSRRTPEWVKWTCMAVSPRKDSSSFVGAILSSIRNDPELEQLAEALSDISRNSKSVQNDAADVIHRFVSRSLEEFVVNENITSFGTIARDFDRQQDYPGGRLSLMELVDASGNLTVIISSSPDSLSPSRIQSMK